MTIDLKHLRSVAEAAMPLNLTQQGDCFTSKEMEYLVAVSNPSTTLSLIDRLEKAEFLLTDLAKRTMPGEVDSGDALLQYVGELKAERDDWKWEYDNLCKFATDYEQQRDALRSDRTDAMDAIREVQQILSKMSGIPSAQEAIQKLNAVFGEVGT